MGSLVRFDGIGVGGCWYASNFACLGHAFFARSGSRILRVVVGGKWRGDAVFGWDGWLGLARRSPNLLLRELEVGRREAAGFVPVENQLVRHPTDVPP